MSFLKLDRERVSIGVAAAVAAVVLVGIAWGFGQQLVLMRRLRVEEKRLERLVATEQARQEELEARLAYVKTDQYVEQWAREEGKMARPGEVVVIPVTDASELEPTTEARPEEAPAPETEAETGARPFWVAWWETIFGRGERP